MIQTTPTFFVSSQTQKNKNVKCSEEHLYMQKYDMFFIKQDKIYKSLQIIFKEGRAVHRFYCF